MDSRNQKMFLCCLMGVLVVISNSRSTSSLGLGQNSENQANPQNADMIAISNITLTSNEEMDAYFAGNNSDGLTPETAYIIKDFLVISGLIRIENTNRYVKIQNGNLCGEARSIYPLTTEPRAAAIHLINASHISIMGCRFHDIYVFGMEAIGVGIITEGCLDLKIIGNYMFQLDHFSPMGAAVIDANESIIQSNFIEYVDPSGSGMVSAVLTIAGSKNEVRDNLVEESTQAGISVTGNNNVVHGNRIISCQGGILCTGDYFLIEENFYYNYDHWGSQLVIMGENSIIRENEMLYPFSIDDIWIVRVIGNNNTLYLNSFMGDIEAHNALYDVGTNYWDNGEFGNYYGDFLQRYPNATSLDGKVWNTPYTLNDTTTKQDNFPLVNAMELGIPLPEWEECEDCETCTTCDCQECDTCDECDDCSCTDDSSLDGGDSNLNNKPTIGLNESQWIFLSGALGIGTVFGAVVGYNTKKKVR